jgi:hypothetical protein
MCDLSGESTSSYWRTEERPARKPRRCDCCGALIAKGERYFNTFALSDGSVCNENACAACNAAIEEFGQAHRFFPFPGSLVPYLEECILGDEAGERWRPMLDAIESRRKAAA